MMLYDQKESESISSILHIQIIFISFKFTFLHMGKKLQKFLVSDEDDDIVYLKTFDQRESKNSILSFKFYFIFLR